jgi:hypothetical protein
MEEKDYKYLANELSNFVNGKSSFLAREREAVHPTREMND